MKNYTIITAYLICLLFINSIAVYAASGIVQNLSCDSGHNETAKQESKIIMSWGYPSGESAASISGFFYAINTTSEYTVTNSDIYFDDLEELKISKTLSNSDNIAYYFHIAAQDKDFISGPNIGASTYYGPMKIDDVAPTGATISGPETTDTIYNIKLSLGATGATQMCISNANYGVDCEWETIASQKNWDLTEGIGEKTVYAQFKDNAGNISNASTLILYEIIIPKTRRIGIPSMNDYGIILFFIILSISAMINIIKYKKNSHLQIN